MSKRREAPAILRRSRRGFLEWAGGSTLVLTLEGIAGILGKRPLTLQAAPHSIGVVRGGPEKQVGATEVTFTDIAEAAGLAKAVNTFGGVKNKRFLIEETGCGVAFFDFDQDGWLDIFLVNGTTMEGFPAGQEPSNYLLRNNRDGTFADITEKSGLKRSGWGQGCCIGDYDNDGFEDLFITYWGSNALYHNNGDGTFTDVSLKAGVAGEGRRWGTGCCFLDYDRDGFLDLFVANYVVFDPAEAPPPGGTPYCRYYGLDVACGPQGLGGGTNILYHNRGDGTFEDVSEKSGVTTPRGVSAPTSVSQNWQPVGSYGLTAVAADLDNDGWPDIYVACDISPSRLYRNNHDGTFREVGVQSGVGLSEDGIGQAGMGVAVGDYDNDGWLDVVKTNFSDDTPNLYHNNGDGTFYDAVMQGGLGIYKSFLSWGTGLVDFDNDGWKDIFIANGHVWPEVSSRKLHVTFEQRRLFFRNLGKGRFEDVSTAGGPGIGQLRSSRGCAFGDFDNDGDVDIVVNNMNAPPSLLRCNGAAKTNWIKVKCIGTKSNRSAIGARVRVVTGQRSQIDEVMSGSGYVSQNDLRLHFGLGPAAIIDLLEIRWPSGQFESFRSVPANQLVVVQEGRGIVKSQKFRK